MTTAAAAAESLIIIIYPVFSGAKFSSQTFHPFYSLNHRRRRRRCRRHRRCCILYPRRRRLSLSFSRTYTIGRIYIHIHTVQYTRSPILKYNIFRE